MLFTSPSLGLGLGLDLGLGLGLGLDLGLGQGLVNTDLGHQLSPWIPSPQNLFQSLPA